MSQFIKPIGGTELMHNELMRRVDKNLIKDISIFNYLSNADLIRKQYTGINYHTTKKQ